MKNLEDPSFETAYWRALVPMAVWVHAGTHVGDKSEPQEYPARVVRHG